MLINTRMKSLVLAEGIKGWATAGEEYILLMDGYDTDAPQLYVGKPWN